MLNIQTPVRQSAITTSERGYTSMIFRGMYVLPNRGAVSAFGES